MNEIILGDAYELIKTIPNKSVDLIITDPPYKIEGLHGSGVAKDTPCYKEMNDAGLGKGIDLSILDEFVRVLKKINIYLWCNKEQIYDYLTYFVKDRGCNWEMLIWAKQNTPPFYGKHYLKDKEYCLYFWEKASDALNIKGFDDGRTVFFSTVNKVDKELYGHPTIKPERFIETLIRNSSVRGG